MATDKRLDQVKLVNSAESVLVVNGDQVEKATLAGFANSMGSSVPLQQTSEQVSITGLYARTSDGKMVELTKESVASVMGDLLGNPLKREYIVTKDNIDVALTPGFYTMVFEPISIGGGTANFYGVMNVYESDTYIVQVGYATTGVILRNYKKSSKVWSAWQRIDNFGYNSLADLSQGVAKVLGSTFAERTIPSGGSITFDCGYGLVVVSSTTSGLVALYANTPSFAVEIYKSRDVNVIGLSKESEYVLRVDNISDSDNNVIISVIGSKMK